MLSKTRSGIYNYPIIICVDNNNYKKLYELKFENLFKRQQTIEVPSLAYLLYNYNTYFNFFDSTLSALNFGFKPFGVNDSFFNKNTLTLLFTFENIERGLNFFTKFKHESNASIYR